MKNKDNVVLVPEFDEQGVACYRLGRREIAKMSIMLFLKQNQESF